MSFLGGQAAVHQFVRIGEGAMIGGLSGVRADVIPFGFVLGQLGRSDRPQRRRHAAARHPRKADIHRLRQAYEACSSATGHFASGSIRSRREYGADPLVGKIIAFIRARLSGR